MATNDGRTLWCSLLQIEEPWSVLEVRIDPHGLRQDIWVGMELPRSWFGRSRKVQHSGPAQSWRHVNFGDWQVRVHVLVPEGTDLSAHAWAGDANLPFTRALSRQVLALLREGCSLQTICSVLNLPLADLWKLRHAIDNGRWSAGDPAGAVPIDEVCERPAGEDALPDAGDPVWRALLEGSRQIDIRVLGLKLLLTRLRSQLEMIVDEDIRMLKQQEFYRYFAKNRHLLAHEIAQIRQER